MDTIYALSSGAVPSGVAVIRISGPEAGKAVMALTAPLPAPRVAALRTLRRPDHRVVIDQGLVLWFPGPKSETGEDLAELQVHGSRAVLHAVFDVLEGAGLRLARPGEFVRRAFENGKLDLTQVEGLADLVDAETEAQRAQALGQAGGRLARKAEGWRRRIIGLRAAAEARLDFSDESDVQEDLPEGFAKELGDLRDELSLALATARDGERVREGFRVAIMGKPNAGKSSLLNALARRDVAIVTEEAGTTRDVLEVPLDLNGYAVLLQDTAGLRGASSLAEREGVRRAAAAGEAADLVLWLEEDPDDGGVPLPGSAPVWHIRSKIDRAPRKDGLFGVSALTGAGLSELEAKLAEAAGTTAREPALITRSRQREAVADVWDALEGALTTADEVQADWLRTAGDALDQLSGRIGVEDVLDRLFSEFCIGK